MSWFTFISVSYVSTCVCTTSFHVYTDCPPPLLPADNLVSLGPGCRRGMEHSHALKTSGRHGGQCWGTLRNYESFCLFSGRWRHLTCFWFFLAELPLVLFQRTFPTSLSLYEVHLCAFIVASCVSGVIAALLLPELLSSLGWWALSLCLGSPETQAPLSGVGCPKGSEVHRHLSCVWCC